MTRAEVAGSIVTVLAPFLGQNMAAAAVEAQIQKIATGEVLSAAETEALVEKLGRGLVVFLGRAKTAKVVESMRAAVASSAPPEGGR